ncbi:MAG: hypothetical protein M1514_00450 [Patescibacteria group bacterium]|nr:hypothetical protein [Patescibacteria group bacterium]
MGFEDDLEKGKSSSPLPSGNYLTLQKAVDMGEYEPKYLANFAEWHGLSRHVQFQLVRQGLENRRHQLLVQWAEISNMLDFSKKPYLKEALKNIEKQLHQAETDRERLYLEYSVGE